MVRGPREEISRGPRRAARSSFAPLGGECRVAGLLVRPPSSNTLPVKLGAYLLLQQEGVTWPFGCFWHPVRYGIFLLIGKALGVGGRCGRPSAWSCASTRIVPVGGWLGLVLVSWAAAGVAGLVVSGRIQVRRGRVGGARFWQPLRQHGLILSGGVGVGLAGGARGRFGRRAVGRGW